MAHTFQFPEEMFTAVDTNGVVVISPVAADALTAEDATVIDATYGAPEQAVVENIRTRLGEVEALLVAAGLLTA